MASGRGMHVCSPSLGNPSLCPNLPLFVFDFRSLHKLPDSFNSNIGTSRRAADHLMVVQTTCRPLTHATDQKKWLASHFYWSADQKFCRTPFLLQQRTRRGTTVYLQDICAQPSSLSFHELKGVWFSTLGPPIEHRNARWPRSQDYTINVIECK